LCRRVIGEKITDIPLNSLFDRMRREGGQQND